MTNVSPASGPSPGAGASPVSSSVSPAAARSSSTLGVGLGNASQAATDSATIGPDALDLRDLVRPGGAQGGERAEVLRDRLGGDRAHVRDAEAEEHPAERALAATRAIEAMTFSAERCWKPSSSSQLLGREGVEIGRTAHEPQLPEARDQLLAHAVDVERAARDEVAQALEAAARAVRVDAAVHGLALEADDLAAAGRAVVGHAELALAAVAPRQHGPDDLRNHVAGALDDHVIADADVLELDHVLVVQRRHAHDHAAHGDRLEHGVRIQRAGPPHVQADVEQPGDRPSWAGT